MTSQPWEHSPEEHVPPKPRPEHVDWRRGDVTAGGGENCCFKVEGSMGSLW
jgi:hypothetical protein